MPSIEQEIKELKGAVQEKRTAYAVKLSKRDELIASLNEYGIKDVKQAEKREEQLEGEIGGLKRRLSALMDKARKRLDEYEREAA